MTEIAPNTRPWENSKEVYNDNINEQDDEWEGGNNSAKLFERSRIKALAGKLEPKTMGAHNKSSHCFSPLKIIWISNRLICILNWCLLPPASATRSR